MRTMPPSDAGDTAPVCARASGSAADLLVGAEQIGAFLGFTVRQTYHLVRRRELPVFKQNGRLCARRAALLDRLQELEREAAAAPRAA